MIREIKNAVTIPFKPGLRFSQFFSWNPWLPRGLSQSRLNPVSDFHFTIGNLNRMPNRLSQSRLNPVSDFHRPCTTRVEITGTMSQSRLNPVSDFHERRLNTPMRFRILVTIPFKPGLRFSLAMGRPLLIIDISRVTIPFKPGLRFSLGLESGWGLSPGGIVTIPFKPGLRFSPVFR